MFTQPVVITGLGVLASNGLGRDAYWNALKNGVSGIRRLDRFDASEMPCQIAGQLWDFNPDDFMRHNLVRNWNRHVHQAVASAHLAVEDSEIKRAAFDPERIAVGVGTSIGSPDESYEVQRQAYESRGYRKVGKMASSAFSGHSATVHVAIENGFSGPAITMASGCTTGLDVLAWGAQQVRSGRADAALVAATESPIFDMSFAGACSLGILSKRNDEPEKAMRPFDKSRDGIVLSEGAVALVLERADYALARGAHIYAEFAGSGSAGDAASPLVLDSEGKGLTRTIQVTLAAAGMAPTDIDCVACHGVSMEMYDRCEVAAYKASLGPHAYRIPFTAMKSMTGQAYAAGGLLSVAGVLMTLREGILPPTINLEDPDPLCDLDFVPNTARLCDIDTALVAGISFGGTYSCCILRNMN